jgi:hypothetical protein
MPTAQSTDRAALGRARLAERARRVARIRRTVVAATLSAFVLFWGVIVFDGPMGTTAAGSTPTTAASTTSSSSSDASTSPSGDTTSTDDTPSAVTTSQS